MLLLISWLFLNQETNSKWWTFEEPMVKKGMVQMLCIHEIKREHVNKELCQALWGDSGVQWVALHAMHISGGLFCMWCSDFFELSNSILCNGFILLEGIWKDVGVEVIMVNIYAPY